MGRKVAWLVLAFTAAFALSWLYLTKRGFTDFVATVREIQSLLRVEEVKLIKSDRVKISFELLIENPKAREIQLEAVSYVLEVNGQYAGHYSREYNQLLKGGMTQLAQEFELNPIYQETLKAELERSDINLRGEVRLRFQLSRAQIKIRVPFIYPPAEKQGGSVALFPALGALG